MNKILTLCVIHNDTRVLLGLKKRGFGVGFWNGFGGKVMPGEAIPDAARREVLEEAGIKVKDMAKRGLLLFEFQDNPEFLEVHVFSAEDFEGEPVESDEMKPQWFSRVEIPFDRMWADDKHWLPMLLAGKNFRGYFYFKDNETMVNYTLEEAREV